MELESKRLKLMEITWADAEYIHKLYSIPEVDKYNTLGIPKNIEETKEHIRPLIESQNSEIRKSYFWKILIKNSETFIGVAGLTLSANKFKLGEIYYKLLPSQWGQGYATEVSKTLIKSGFDDFHLHKIEAGVATEILVQLRF